MIPKIYLVINLIIIITLSFIIGKVFTFILMLLRKWRVLDWYEMHKKRWMPKRCEFCLLFWMGMIAMIPIYFLLCYFGITFRFSDPVIYLYCFIPLVTTVIAYEAG